MYETKDRDVAVWKMQTLRLFEKAHNVEVKQPDVPPPHSMYTHTHVHGARARTYANTFTTPLWRNKRM